MQHICQSQKLNQTFNEFQQYEINMNQDEVLYAPFVLGTERELSHRPERKDMKIMLSPPASWSMPIPSQSLKYYVLLFQ